MWKKLALAAGTSVGCLVLLEVAARVSLSLGLVGVDPPMITQLPPGTADWRMAHITADRHRQPDPLLWWRPVAEPPYNRQRMKGPVAAIPKPPGLMRIMTYGDSNTDGPDRGAWPERLGRALQGPAGPGGRRVQVLNAGVAGYSSHQGLLRFQAQAPRFEPDLVLVSFGWNDLATARTADDAFQPPSPLEVALRRSLLKLRLYRVGRRYARTPPAEAGTLVPRVSLPDYLRNLGEFVRVGRAHGAVVVLLTRPHRQRPAELRALAPNWRARVPAYNAALLDFAAAEGVNVIDVQGIFQRRFPSEFVDECHFTPEGHARMAALLAAELRARGLL